MNYWHQLSAQLFYLCIITLVRDLSFRRSGENLSFTFPEVENDSSAYDSEPDHENGTRDCSVIPPKGRKVVRKLQ